MNLKKLWEGIRAGWTITKLVVKIPHSQVVDDIMKVIEKAEKKDQP